MPTAHLYLYSDACPSDWLSEESSEKWHTISNFAFQSDPTLLPLIECGKEPHEVLRADSLFSSFVQALQSNHLPSNELRKWRTGPSYRTRFCKAFEEVVNQYKPIVSAISFQEKTLRESKKALYNAYNQKIGSIEGRGIGFEEFCDDKGRLQLKYSFVNFGGYHEIQCPENQMLVLLLMSWFVIDQHIFYRKDIVDSGKFGFDSLAFTIVSDKLSGDNEFRSKSEQNLRNLIDPNGAGSPITLTRSPKSDIYAGDLIVDNIAGWLNFAISDPSGEFAQRICNLTSSGIWAGWYILIPSSSKLESVNAVSQLCKGINPNPT
jgi:hypothetical protein